MTRRYGYEKKAGSHLEYWPILSSLILALYFAMLYFPPLSSVLPQAYVCLGCFVLWLILSVINDSSYYLNIKPFVLIAVVFYAFTIIIPFICGYTVIANRYASLVLIPFGFVIYDYYKTHGYENYLRNVLLISAAFAAVTGFNTYVALLKNPYIARSIKNSGAHSAGLASRGIGGYTFIYAVAAAAPILLYIFLKTKKIAVKVLSLAAYIFSIILITKSNYLTAFLLIIISSTVLICGYLLSLGRKIALYIPVIVIAVALFIVFYDPISEFIQSHIPDRIARVLFNPSGDSMSQNINQEFEEDRLPSILNSFNAIIRNPLFGILGSGSLGVSGGLLNGFGQHSYILDTFALFGVIIGLLPLVLLTQLFRKDGRWVTKDFYLSIAMIISVFFIYILNNVTDSIAVVFTMVYPMVRDHYIDSSVPQSFHKSKNFKKGNGFDSVMYRT